MYTYIPFLDFLSPFRSPQSTEQSSAIEQVLAHYVLPVGIPSLPLFSASKCLFPSPFSQGLSLCVSLSVSCQSISAGSIVFLRFIYMLQHRCINISTLLLFMAEYSILWMDLIFFICPLIGFTFDCYELCCYKHLHASFWVGVCFHFFEFIPRIGIFK